MPGRSSRCSQSSWRNRRSASGLFYLILRVLVREERRRRGQGGGFAMAITTTVQCTGRSRGRTGFGPTLPFSRETGVSAAPRARLPTGYRHDCPRSPVAIFPRSTPGGDPGEEPDAAHPRISARALPPPPPGRGGGTEGSALWGRGRRPDMVCYFGIDVLAGKRHTERFFLAEHKLPLFFAPAFHLSQGAQEFDISGQ